jgi:endonuclease YncB( thermonuclease family)
VRIADGDTLQIGPERIRLFGIDAPELHQSCNDDRGSRYACGEVAKNALRRHVGDAPVMCVPVDRDQYGRAVARCYINNEDLNRWMVASGWAVAYTQFSRDYVRDEEAARRERRGMWVGEFMLPSRWRRQERRER